MKLLLQNYSFKNLFSRRAKYNEDSSSSAASSYMELKDKDEANVSADEIPIPMPAIPPPLWKPSWRCFAFDEVCGATNNFHAGMCQKLSVVPGSLVFICPKQEKLMEICMSILD